MDRGNRLFEDEAEEASDDNGRGDEEPEEFEDSSEEDDDLDTYENDGFLAGDDEEISADDEEEEQRRKKKKRRRRDDSPDLAEGDLLLLQDAGAPLPRRKKRLQRLQRSAEDEEDYDLDIGYAQDRGREVSDEEDEEERKARRAREQDVDYESDEMEDFIDDGGRARRRRRAQRRGLVSSEAVQDARRIFGDPEEVHSYRGMRKLFDENLANERPQSGDDVQVVVDSTSKPPADKGERESSEVDALVNDAAGVIGKLSVTTEPSLTVERYLTKRDDLVRKTDIPEALQLHMGTRRQTLTKAEIDKESSWIYKYAFASDPAFSDLDEYVPKEMVLKIGRVLSYMYVEKMDIPFIAIYRKDYISPELLPKAGGNVGGHPVGAQGGHNSRIKGYNSVNYDGFDPKWNIEYQTGPRPGYDDGFGDWCLLWRILDWDKRWAHLEERRWRLLKIIDDSREKLQDSENESLREIAASVRDAETEEGIADCERYVRITLEIFALADDDEKGLTSTSNFTGTRRRGRRHKRPLRRDLYREYLAKGYRALAEKFGMSARQFAENMKAIQDFGQKYQVHVPTEPESDPVVLARDLADHLNSAAEVDRQEGKRVGRVEQNPEKLLAAARHLMATEILAETRVADYARSLFSNSDEAIFVDAKPTQRAMVEVDTMHPMRPFVSIQGKPISAFYNSTDFAMMVQAEEEGLTSITIRLNEETAAKLRLDLENSFRDPVPSDDPIKTQWEAQRKLVIGDVLNTLLRRVKTETRTRLKQMTEEVVSRRFLNACSRRLLVGPARPDPEMEGTPRVLAVSLTLPEDEEYDPVESKRNAEEHDSHKHKLPKGRPSPVRVTFAALNANGELIDNYELYGGRWLVRHAKGDLPEKMKKELNALIAKLRPQVIVVGIGSGGKYALRLRHDLITVLAGFIFNKRADFFVSSNRASQEFDLSISEDRERLASRYVYLVDEAPARLYAMTASACVGLPDSSVTLLERRALGIGRLVQEPLLVYTAIASSPVAASLSFHPLDRRVPLSTRSRIIRRALVRAVASVGVDLNRLLVSPHMHSLLAFVPGLGPRKAQQLLAQLENSVAEEGQVTCRKDLPDRSILSTKVFISAAAFLRIRDPDMYPGTSTKKFILKRSDDSERKHRSDDLLYDPLDDTRIHPETYAIALKIADEAQRDDKGQSILPDHLSGTQVTAAVMKDSRGLSSLDLEQYAQHLEKIGRGKLYSTVQVIAAEYRSPFRDCRDALPESPQPKALFYIVTHADPLTFRVGAKVGASGCRLTKSLTAIFCDLPYNVSGFISRGEFADESVSPENLRKLVPHGATIPAIIIGFNFDKLEVRLSTRPSILKSPTSLPDYLSLCDPSDNYIRDFAQSYGGLKGNAARVARAGVGIAVAAQAVNADEIIRKRMMRRQAGLGADVTQNPFYRNITGAEAVENLRDGRPGEFLIRPGMRKGVKFVFSGAFVQVDRTSEVKGIVHYDVSELRDDNGVVKYRVGDVTYDEVEEIIQNFVIPVLANLEEATTHRKFRLGTEAELGEMLKQDKSKNKNTIPYCVGVSTKFAGYLVLAYIPGTKTVRKEIIKVVPAGYQLRKVLHKDLNTLIAWFKKNVNTGAPEPSDAVRGATEMQDKREGAAVNAGARPERASPAPPDQRARQDRPGGRDIYRNNFPEVVQAYAHDRAGAPSRPRLVERQRDAPPPPPPPPPMAVRRYDEPPPPIPTGSGRTPVAIREAPPIAPSMRETFAERPMQTQSGPGAPGRSSRGMRMPPPRGPPARGAGMPSWRGAKPVPAWQAEMDKGERVGRKDPRGEGMPDWRGARPVPAWQKEMQNGPEARVDPRQKQTRPPPLPST